MADSRIPPLPPSSVEPSVRAPPDSERTVRLVSLPERLYDIQKAVILRGAVSQVDTNGAVRILTDQGEVTVEGEKPLDLHKGEQVEIRVPPGRPPRNAELRPAPPEVPRNVRTDIDLRVPPSRTEPDSEPVYTSKVLEGQIVRAVSIPASEASQVLPPEPEVIEHFIDRVAFSLQNTTQIAEKEIFETLKSLSVFAPTLKYFLKPQPLYVLPSPQSQTLLPLPEGALPSAQELQPVLSKITKSLFLLQPSGLQVPLFEIGSDQKPLENLFLPESVIFRISRIESAPAFLPDVQQNSPLVSSLRAGDALAVVLGPLPGKDALAVHIVFPGAAQPQPFALLDTGPPPPAGTSLTLSALTQLPAQNLQELAPFLPSFLTADTWPALQEVLNVLPQVAPQAAQSLINMLPSPSSPQQIAPTALFFIAAVRAGDIEGWLGGRVVDALRRADRGDLLSRLSQDVSALSRTASEPIGQDWKALSLPLYWQNQLFKIPVYTKQDPDGRSGRDGEKGSTRFIINLDLSRMGKIQMDALYQKAAKRFDLILRTEQSFTKAMEQEMRGLFSGALGEVFLKGELLFQTGADKWVTVQADKAYSFSANY